MSADPPKPQAARRRLLPVRWGVAMAAMSCAGAGAAWQRATVQPSADSPSASSAAHVIAGGNSVRSPGNPSAPGAPAMPTRESLYALTPMERLAAVAAALPYMQVADLMPLVEALARSPGADPDPVDPLDYTYAPDWETPMLRALLARWVELDAPGLMALMDAPGFRHDYRTRSLAVFAYVEARGISAIGEMRNSSPTLAAQAAREVLARNPAQLDSLLPLLASLPSSDPMMDRMELAPRLGPERFLRYAAAVGDSGSARSTISEIRDAQGQAAALLLVKDLPPGSTREALLEGLLTESIFELSRVGLFNGLEFCREYEALPPGRVRDNLLHRYAETLAAIDPPAALAWARALPRGPQRGTALDRISQALPEGTPPQEITRLLAESWLADPLAHKVEIPSVSGSTFPLYYSPHGSVRDAFRAWHGQNPAEAAAWLETVTLPSLRSELVKVLMSSGAGNLSDIPDSSARLEYAIEVLYNDGIPFSPPAEDLPPESIVPPELEAIARREKNTNRGIHPGWEPASLEDHRALAEAGMRTSLQFGEAESAVQFFDSIAPEERSLGAYYQAGLAHMRQDEEEASRWMESLPRGPGRDAAVTALVEQLSAPGPERDSEAAFAWAASMSGEAERARFTAQAAEAWASADPAAARAAIQSAPLPAAEKQALLRRLPEGGPQ